MSKKESKTAAELMAALNRDPAFLQRQAEKERRRAERRESYALLEHPVLEALGAAGYKASSITNAVEAYAPLPDGMVRIFLEWLDKTNDRRLLDPLVRALGAAAHPFDGRPLAKCYDSANDVNLRWAIINTIVLTHPHSIDRWVAKVRRDEFADKTFRELGVNA